MDWIGFNVLQIYLFYWKLFPKVVLNTWVEYLHTQFTLLRYNMFSGTHSWKSAKQNTLESI